MSQKTKLAIKINKCVIEKNILPSCTDCRYICTIIILKSSRIFSFRHHFVCQVHTSIRLRHTLKILFNLLTSPINDIYVFIKRLSLFKKGMLFSLS